MKCTLTSDQLTFPTRYGTVGAVRCGAVRCGTARHGTAGAGGRDIKLSEYGTNWHSLWGILCAILAKKMNGSGQVTEL